MAKLFLKNVIRKFGAVRAVDGVDIALEEGELISLLGPSGCGKTTTLRMIAGFLDVSEGSIELDSAVISSPAATVPPERRGMSMIFQSYAIWPNMTVGENVAFGLKLRKLPSSETRRRVAEMLEMVQLLHLIDRYPGELSGGQQQRVALARAIIIRPSVLLLDEPLSNLDAKLREEMRLEIRRLHEEFKMTTVYVTHDQGEAMVTSDRIAVMNGGRIEQIDRPYELYMRPTTQFVASFLGRTNFIKATVTDKRISFCGLDLPIARINVVPPESGDVIISIRPQFMTLRKGEVATTGAETVINGVVVRRYFYGDYWDYMVRCEETGEVLCVNARPQDAVEVGTRVGLEIDPTLIAPLASSNPAAVRPGSAVESIRS